MSKTPLLLSFLAFSLLLIAAATAHRGAGSLAMAGPVKAQSNSLTLLMVEQDGCIYCEAWHEEIGTGYENSAEGQRAPLRRVDINGPWPDALVLDRRPTITPTFILLRGNAEIARLEGYPGSNFFYPLISEMIAKSSVQDPVP